MEKATRELIEITFVSIGGVIDAPDIVQEAQPCPSKAYVAMAKSGQGAPHEVSRHERKR